MKKVMAVVICMVAVLVLAGIGQAAESTKWPTKTTGLLAKLSSGTNVSAIFNLGKGTIEVDCATKVEGGYDNIRVFKCPTVGAKQKCQPVSGGGTAVEVKVYDTMAVKAQKVCGGAGYTVYK